MKTQRKKRRASRAETAALENEIFAVLEADPGQSVRHVFYRMTDTRLSAHVEKTELGYRRIRNRLSVMRKAGQYRGKVWEDSGFLLEV